MTAANYSQENTDKPAATNPLEISQLHFGEDYRLFISSLSDSSVTEAVRSPQSKYRRTKKLRRKNKRREVINKIF